MAMSTSSKNIKGNGGIIVKKKDIKKIMKQQIESHIPSSAPLIDFPFEKPEYKVEEIRQPKFNFKLVMSSVLAVLIIVFIVVMLPEGGVNPPNLDFKLSDENQVLSFSAVSSISLLSSMGTNELISYDMQTQTGIESPLISHVIPYLKSAEKLFLSDSGLNIITETSTLPEFEYVMRFETKNLLGNAISYEMYYNLILQNEEDDESEYQLTGILWQGVESYNVTGQKEIEDDEEKIKFKAYKDETSYVESIYEIENDQQTFTFKAFQFNELISESKFKIEYENDETKIELEFIEEEDQGKFEFEYFVENDKNYIKIEFETEIDGIDMSGEMTVRMDIDDLTGDVTYHFVVDPDDDDPYEYDVEDEEDEEKEDEEKEDD